MALKYLITGVARSGTGYMAQTLNSAGVPCGHEAIFSHGGLEEAAQNLKNRPEMEAESSWLAVPFLGSDILKDTGVIHLVRHPIKTIESILRVKMFSDSPYSRYILQRLPGIAQHAKLENMVAYYYLMWHHLIERHAHLRHRVEDDPAELLDALGIEYRGLLFDDRAYNHRPEYPPYELDVGEVNPILWGQVVEMGRRFGYDF